MTMTDRAGAIVRIICYILEQNNRRDQPFDAGYIVAEYERMLADHDHKREIQEIIQYKNHHKNSTFYTFQTVSKMKHWLGKHSGKKEIRWFNGTEANFTLIEDTCGNYVQS